MMKKILAVVFALMMAFCFAACGSSEPAESEEATEATEAESIDGGWEIPENPAAAELPNDVQATFDKFESEYDDELIPMAYYGYQEGKVTNYGLLCKSKGDNELQTVIIAKNSDMDTFDAVINTFNVADYTEGEGADISTEVGEDGWVVAEDYTTAEIPKEAFEAYDAATAQFVGNDLHPMAYLGSQVVEGTNYAFLCHSSLVTAEPVTSIQVVTVYEDLEGNCEILNIYTLDLESFDE